MARTILQALAVTLALGLPASPGAHAATTTATPDSVMSHACEAPGVDLGMPAPLPRTVERLRGGGLLRVLAIGSSSTAGVGASSPATNYPAQVEAILERRFKGLDVVMVNRGVSGEASSATAQRLRTQVAIENPDVVLWQVGTNDALARIPVAEFEETVAESVRWLREHRIDVVLVGMQYTPKMARDPYYATVRSALAHVAASEGVTLVRRFEAMEYLQTKRERELMSSDGLHLNDLGYQCMAEHVARAMVAGAFQWQAARAKP